MAVNWSFCTLQDCERLHFPIMVRDGHRQGFMEEFRVQTKQKVRIDACRSGRFDLWR
jgi:hypothetical protein